MTPTRRQTQQSRNALRNAIEGPAKPRGVAFFHYKGTDPIPEFAETMDQYYARVLKSRMEKETL